MTDKEKLQEAIDTSIKEFNRAETLKTLLKRKEQECEKYKQALAKVKEICNSVENIENINSLYDAKLSGMYLQANKILKKISECEASNAR